MENREMINNDIFTLRLSRIAQEMRKQGIAYISADLKKNGEVDIYGCINGTWSLQRRVRNVIVVVPSDKDNPPRIKTSEEWFSQLNDMFHFKIPPKRKSWSISPKNQLKPFLTPMQEVTNE